jgi:septal ring factor EnvC (AmiA/AmiB activator)
MLYEQLSQQLQRTARATTGSARRDPPPGALAGRAAASGLTPPADGKAALSEEDLYSPLAGEEQSIQEDENDLARALEELRADLEKPAPSSEKGAAIRAEIAAALSPAQDSPEQPELTAPKSAPEKTAGLKDSSWRRDGLVSAKPKPVSSLGRRESQDAQQTPETAPAGARSRGLPLKESLWPYDGKVLSRFGRTETPDGERRWNSGLTLEGVPGDPVRAAMDGTILFSGRHEGYGQTIILEHGDGLLSYYGNVEAEGLKVGDAVARGTEFAKIRAQASATGKEENSAPLFFALKRGEVALNPEAAIVDGRNGK